MPLNKTSQTWNFTGATCENGQSVNIIPFVEDFRMQLVVTAGEGSGSVRKTATFGNCPENLITTEFSYKDLNTNLTRDLQTQSGQMLGQKVNLSTVNYEGFKSCGRYFLSLFTRFLYEVTNYTEFELKRNYTYSLNSQNMSLSFKDSRDRRCDVMTMHFKSAETKTNP
jgi:hypothetical protein